MDVSSSLPGFVIASDPGGRGCRRGRSKIFDVFVKPQSKGLGKVTICIPAGSHAPGHAKARRDAGRVDHAARPGSLSRHALWHSEIVKDLRLLTKGSKRP